MRTRIDLNGTWDLRVESHNGQDCSGDTSRWPRSILVPQAWELALGPTFNGQCCYLTSFERPPIPERSRVWLHFEAVATHTEVTVNGRMAGSHSGNWTPFEFDITELLRNGENQLAVRVREDPGHVTFGFSSVAMPHHGGIWQDVYLEIRPETRIIEPVLVASDLSAGQITVTARCCAANGSKLQVEILTRDGSETVISGEAEITDSEGSVVLDASRLRLWDVGQPNLYIAKVRLSANGEIVDEVSQRFGYREVRTEDRHILLNGRPLYPRGWLTWGVYPEHIAPAPTPEQVRKELSDLIYLGFNMSKLCLWLPPRHYLDIADEMGVLVWLEYPTWQTMGKIGPQHYPEFDELFLRDVNSPSIIIRSLTCEATLSGANVDLQVIKHLYKRAHELIPGCIVIDNSGFFLNWSQKHDPAFTDAYSDHPYLDCHHFNAHLDALVARLSEVEPKPFATGESMDCDTCRDFAALHEEFGRELPWWLDWDPENKPAPLCLTPTRLLEARNEQSAQEIGRPLHDMVHSSYQHALSHLKFQVESYRKRGEFTGYTLIGIRDSVGNTPGFYDDLGRLKYTREQMLPFNGDTVLLVDTHRPHYNYRAGEQAALDVLVSCFDECVPSSGTLCWTISTPGREISSGSSNVTIAKGQVCCIGPTGFDVSKSTSPEVYTLHATLALGGAVVNNSWKLWAFPEPVMPQGTVLLEAGDSLAHIAEMSGVCQASDPGAAPPPDTKLLITDTLNDEIGRWIEAGGRAVVVVGPTGPLQVEGSCFWREAVEVFARPEALGDFPHENFVDLQFLPLSTNHKLVSAPLSGKCDVLLRRMNPRTSLYGDDLVQMHVGDGVIIACTLNLGGRDNFTGTYLLSQLAAYALDCEPEHRIDWKDCTSLLAKPGH